MRGIINLKALCMLSPDAKPNAVHRYLFELEKQDKQIWFDRTVMAHILYFLSDIGWAAVISGQLPRARILFERQRMQHDLQAVSVTLYNYPDSRGRSVNRDEAGHWNRDTGL